MFRHLIAAGFVACLAATPTVGSAQSAETRRPAPEAPGADLVNRIVEALAPYRQMIVDSEELLGLVVEGMADVVAKDEEGSSRAEVRLWYASWQVQLKARQAGLRRLVAETEGKRIDLPASSSGSEAAIRLIESVPGQARELAGVALKFSDEHTELVDKAARGDKAALAALPLRVHRATGLIISAENALLEEQIALSPPKQPVRALTQSILSSNRALAEMLDLMMNGQEPTPASINATVRRVEDHLADARGAADLAARLADRLKAAVIADPAQGDPRLQQMAITIFGTFEGSAAAERKIIEILGEGAAGLRQGDVEALTEAMESLEGAVDERLRFDKARVDAARR